MEFGIQFFPDVGPEHKAPDVYFNECLALVDLVDRYGYGHVHLAASRHHRRVTPPLQPDHQPGLSLQAVSGLVY